MATDNSPPRTKLIAIIAFGTVVTLIGLKFLFDSYFTQIMEAEARTEEKVSRYEEIRAIRADEAAALTGGAHAPVTAQNKTRNNMTIDEAMKQFATLPRTALGGIDPHESTDTAPLVGWSKGARAAAAAANPSSAALTPGGGAPAPDAHHPETADGGAPMVTADGGPAPLAAGDAGATHNAAAHDAGAKGAAPRR